jgi:hypothetical protein
MSALKILATATALLIGAASLATAQTPDWRLRRNAQASGGAGTHSTAVRTGSAINRQKIHHRLNGYPPH